MILPTEKQCLDWFNEYKVPQQVREHCLCVQRVADFLAEKVQSQGVAVRTDLVNRMALLHDLFKVVSIKNLGPTEKYPDFNPTKEEIGVWKSLRKKYPGLHEGEVSYLIFKKDYPELALSLRKVSTPGIIDRNWEEGIVHYADWRVNHNRIVSLKERLDYLKKTYPKGTEFWQEDEKIIREFENKLMGLINIEAVKLADEIRNKEREIKNAR
ncbi:MAG TPA: hypothetical protein VJA23_01565 [Candidatus Nanoarchaeia archaeon]|nr:hypothetical protein [Candidatus Nanoarchaeia archaeon]